MKLLSTSIGLLLLAMGGTILAQQPAQVFETANTLYAQGNFPEAAESYESLLRTGKASPAVLFNLGNARWKSGEIGRALAAYRNAEKLAPRDADLQVNLAFMREQVQGPSFQPTRPERWFGRFTLNEWTAVACIPLWLWLGSLTLTQLRPALQRTLRGLTWCAGVLTIAGSICVGAAMSLAGKSSAVVVVDSATVHTGPLEESQAAFVVHDGAELRVLDRKDDWIQVNAGHRRIGWIQLENIVLLGETQRPASASRQMPVLAMNSCARSS